MVISAADASFTPVAGAGAGCAGDTGSFLPPFIGAGGSEVVRRCPAGAWRAAGRLSIISSGCFGTWRSPSPGKGRGTAERRRLGRDGDDGAAEGGATLRGEDPLGGK